MGEQILPLPGSEGEREYVKWHEEEEEAQHKRMTASKLGIRLAIKTNNCATNDPCAVCSSRTDPRIGPELFLEESMAVVCHPCGEKIDPTLMALLKLGLAADWYVGTINGEERLLGTQLQFV